MNTEEISIEAFPNSLINDLNELNKIVTLETRLQKTRPFEVCINSELIKIPYRIYVTEIDEEIEKDLSEMQRLILNSYYTRHHNGYIREERLRKIITSDEPWIVPYVLHLVGEYVCEIISIIDKNLEHIDLERYKHFINNNPEYYFTIRQRVVSYWDCYYKNVYSKNEYPGYKIIKCFDKY